MLGKSKVTVGLVVTGKKELIVDIFLENWKHH